MKKSFLLSFVCLFSFAASHAQIGNIDNVKKELETENKDTIAWTHSGIFDLGFNEGFLHNWAAGGELASLTVNGIFSGNITRLHGRDVWSNTLNLNYGLYYAYSNSFIPRKTDDRIDFTSKYGVRIDTSKNFYLTSLFNFQSQFTKGYDYTLPHWDSISTSNFLSPAYFTLAEGIEYRKGTDITLFLSPIAGRATVASKYYTSMDPAGAFGVPYNKTVRYEFGAYFSGTYVINISKKAVFKTRLDLYSNYLAKDTKDSTGKVVSKDSPGNIAVLSDNLLSYKVSKYLNMTLGATFIYDNNVPYSKTYVDPSTGATVDKNLPGDGLGWLQVKQVFTLGIEYKF